MANVLLVALGGGLGSAGRYLVYLLAVRLFGERFGWGTLAVNLSGCLAIGFVTGLADLALVPAPLRLFLVAGVLGGLTTFSAFSNETVRHFIAGDWGLALANAALNIGPGLLLTAAGLRLAGLAAGAGLSGPAV